LNIKDITTASLVASIEIVPFLQWDISLFDFFASTTPPNATYAKLPRVKMNRMAGSFKNRELHKHQQSSKSGLFY